MHRCSECAVTPLAIIMLLYLGFNVVMARAVSLCVDTFTECVTVCTCCMLLDKFEAEEIQYVIETHHNNCNHQSSDTNQINLIWEQFLDPAVATLQRKIIKILFYILFTDFEVNGKTRCHILLWLFYHLSTIPWLSQWAIWLLLHSGLYRE